MTSNTVSDLRNRIYNEQTLFSQRLTMFFIAESMLIISYVTSLNIEFSLYISSHIRLLLGVAGLIVTIFFLLVFSRNAFEIMDIENWFKKFESGYKSFSTPVNIFLGVFFPLIFIGVWSGFLYYFSIG